VRCTIRSAVSVKKCTKVLLPISRRVDQIIQIQLDEHAARIKKLETAVLSK
jgi:hypothetical protein